MYHHYDFQDGAMKARCLLQLRSSFLLFSFFFVCVSIFPLFLVFFFAHSQIQSNITAHTNMKTGRWLSDKS